MDSTSLHFLFILLLGGGFVLLGVDDLNPIVKRMVAAAAILGLFLTFFAQLFPNAPLSIAVLYVVPMVFLFALAAVWGERKGQLWPHGNRPYTQGVINQVWLSMIFCLAAFTDGFGTLYEYYFLDAAKIAHPLIRIPLSTFLPIIDLLTAVMGFGFILQFWRFIRMLPPKNAPKDNPKTKNAGIA